MSPGTDIPADAWQDTEQVGLRKRKNDVAAYQYFSAGRISIAPPRRAAGTLAATLIAASTFSASRTKYPPTAPRASTKGPFVVSVLPSCMRTVVASWGSPSGSPGVRPGVLFNASYSAEIVFFSWSENVFHSSDFGVGVVP